MNKKRMRELIDREQGEGFSKNISLEGYTFYKNDSFIVFKMSRVEGEIVVANIKYLYSDNKEDLITVIAYACNYWLGVDAKFIYYKEKRKAPYVVKTMKNLGFRIIDGEMPSQWSKPFRCKSCGEIDCDCMIIEAYA